MSRKRYTKEFKLGALKLVESIGVTKVSQELGVTPKTLRSWSMNEDSIYSSQSKTKKSLSDLEAELREVKKENQRLKQINEVLKKSTAIFSKDHLGD